MFICLNYACGAYVDVYGGKNGLFVSFFGHYKNESLSKEMHIENAHLPKGVSF